LSFWLVEEGEYVVLPFDDAQGFTPAFGRVESFLRERFERRAEARLYLEGSALKLG